MNYTAQVQVSRKAGIADPEGFTIERALPALDFRDVTEVTVGKIIWMQVAADDETQAAARVRELCDRLLTNPVIEDAEIAISLREDT